MGAELRVPHPRQHRGGGEEGRVERGRADEDLPADAEHRAHLGEARALRVGVRAEQLGDEGGAHARLRDRSARGRAGDPPAEAVDEQQLEAEVDEVRDDDDLERAPQVRDAAQVALSGEGDERAGKPERGDPEVDVRVVARLAARAEAAEERAGERLAGAGQREADPERDPERLRREPRRPLLPARAGGARDDGGRPVGEEVEDREGAREDGAGEPERGDLRPAEMADDRRVDEDVERLGRQRPERRQREPHDLPVVGGAQAHRRTVQRLREREGDAQLRLDLLRPRLELLDSRRRRGRPRAAAAGSRPTRRAASPGRPSHRPSRRARPAFAFASA